MRKLPTAPSFIPSTAEEILALNGDGTHRELIRGALRERPDTPYTWKHGVVSANLATLLGNWLDSQPEPRGELLAGNVGFILGRDPDSIVAIDVAYISADLVAQTPPEQFCVEGPPVLAVEILSPWDKYGELAEKVDLYLDCGTVVWVIDPHFEAVTVHRPGHPPKGLNTLRDLSGDPYLPGFRTPVAAIFE